VVMAAVAERRARTGSSWNHSFAKSVHYITKITAFRSDNMLGLVVTLLIIALIAGILGFGGIAGAAVGFAQIIFLVALMLLVVSLLFGGLRGGFGRPL
jgi:uncharacterized membrane protein YtjA (UPF0391 family)